MGVRESVWKKAGRRPPYDAGPCEILRERWEDANFIQGKMLESVGAVRLTAAGERLRSTRSQRL